MNAINPTKQIVSGSGVVGEHTTTNLNAASLWPFIQGQATLHGAQMTGSLEQFRIHLRMDNLRAQRNDAIRLLNCRLMTIDEEPLGYALFNPGFDSAGNYGFYMEDVFIADEARGKGLGQEIWSRISKRAIQEGATFLKWVTDERNIRMMGFAEKKLGAVRANEDNFDATSLLTCAINESEISRFDTRKITIYDASALKQLGINPENITPKAGNRLPLVGFITREKDSPNTAVAATIGYLNYSTFKTQWGLILEPTVFGNAASENLRPTIIKSIISAAQKFKLAATDFFDYNNGSTQADPEIGFIKWHSAHGSSENSILTREFNLQADSMVGNERSTLILYLMKQDSIKMAANLSCLWG